MVALQHHYKHEERMVALQLLVEEEGHVR